MKTRYATCPLCEAMCGLEVGIEDDRLIEIRGDHSDPLSRGFMCPKAMALTDLQSDPERLRTPLIREGGRWKDASWDTAIGLAAERLAAIQRQYGPDSVAFYTGNPNLHSYAAQLLELEFSNVLGTRNLYSTASIDHLPHLFASYHMFGHQLLLPVPDLDRTMCLLIFGANPAISNGSLMSAPGFPRRLREIQHRGGRVFVFDPCRTLTAKLADRHYAIPPGRDAFLLLALISTLFDEKMVKRDTLESAAHGFDRLEQISRSFNAEWVAPYVAIPADEIRAIARIFATSSSAVCYGRVGVCTQEFGATCQWLINALNFVTGNLNRSGGAMFPTPAVDIVKVGSLLRQRGSFARWTSRVRHLPEFNGQLPVAGLADEIATPGENRVRALITSAGNPVLSTPNGAQLAAAMGHLDFMVAIDFYRNETNSLADVILPPTSALERAHYDVVFRAFGVRNTARYSLPLFPAPAGTLHDWQIYCRLGSTLALRRGGWRAQADWARLKLVERITPTRILALLLRFGPYGSGLRFWRKGLTLASLEAEDHASDLGPLEPWPLSRLATADKRVHLAPDVFQDELLRLEKSIVGRASRSGLMLIGRRQLRSNNSWMHRFPRLRSPQNRCTLLMNPVDAGTRALAAGDLVEVRSRAGKIQTVVELSIDIMPGVVSLPHGFGPAGQGDSEEASHTWPAASVNDVTDELRLDTLSGTTAFSGVPVEVLKLPNPVVTAASSKDEPALRHSEQICRHS